MPGATDLLHIPFNAGAHEEVDNKLLPQGLLRRAENVRLRRSGSLGVRYGYTAQPNTDDESNALTVYDVASHDGVLLAFGTTTAGASGPTRVHTLTGGAWRAEDHNDGRSRAFNVVSGVEEVYRPAFVKTDETMHYDLAYASGYLALVHESESTQGSVFVSVFDATTGAEILATEVADRSFPRVAAVNGTFAFAWVTTGGDVAMVTFDPLTATSLGSDSVIVGGPVGAGLDLVAVSGATQLLLVSVRTDTNVCTLTRLDASLSTLATGTLTHTNVVYASVVSVSGGVTHVAYLRDTNEVYLETFTTSTLVSSVGPTDSTIGSGLIIGIQRPPGLVVQGSTVVVLASDSITGTLGSLIVPVVFNAATHAIIGTLSSDSVRYRVNAHSKPALSPDGLTVLALSPVDGNEAVGLNAVIDVVEPQGFEYGVHRGFAADVLLDWIGSVATDGARYWVVSPTSLQTGSQVPVVVQFSVSSPERRQTASLGGLLYVAGGAPMVWDGQRLVESGFLETPRILGVATSGIAGGLTTGASYSYVTVFEWTDGKGNRHLSPVSDPVAAVASGGATSLSVQFTTPQSARRVLTDNASGKVLLFRTLAAPDRTFRLVASRFADSAVGQPITVIDSMSDATARTQEVVYTQGARGSLSGPLQHQAPEPAEYVWATRDRLLLGGLPSASQWQQSKRLFPAEPMQFSSALAFFGSIRGDVTAVASQDGLDYVFSRNEIFVIEGAGPDDNGNGEFASPRKLPGDDVGCIDWRSVVASAAGIWFQASPDRLYLLPRGGGAPEWAGQPVRETLQAFPVVTAAAVVANDNVVCWAVQNAGGSAGRLVCHDTRSGEWYVDTLSDLGGPITAMCEHESRLAVVVGGRVYLQNTTFPASTFLTYGVTTGAIAPFGADAHGRMVSATVAAEYRGACQVQASISYDDEGAFTAIGTPFDVSGFTVGDTVELQWWPLRRKGSRFTLRFDVTAPSGGAATEGVLFNHLTLEVQRARRPRRTTSAERR